MTSFLKSLFLFLCIAFLSCGQEKKATPKEKWEVKYEKQKQLDTLNLTEANKLSQTSNAIIGWDTTDCFTYSLQELIEADSKPFSFIGEIKDIIKKDSSYILKVMNTNSKSSKSFWAEISVSSAIFQTLKSKLDAKESNEGCFIFQVTSIKSGSMLKIDSEVYKDYDAETADEANENMSSELTYDFRDVLLFFKGNLIDYYVYKHLTDKDD